MLTLWHFFKTIISPTFDFLSTHEEEKSVNKVMKIYYCSSKNDSYKFLYEYVGIFSPTAKAEIFSILEGACVPVGK